MTDNLIKLPERFVIDASIAVKWFSVEKDTPKARSILQKMQNGEKKAVAPDILIYEVMNALWKGKKEDTARITKVAEELSLSSLKILHLNSNLTQESIKFMVKYDLTFYDAAYAGLSKLLNIPLLTANSKDHAKVKEIETITL